MAMEANFFRHFIQEVAPRLQGKRIEKIYQPQNGLWTLKLGSQDFLLLLVSAKTGWLMRTASKPDNPPAASSEVQWWRKRVQGRRVGRCLAAWPVRQLALELSPGPGSWLVLDIRAGLALIDDLPCNFGREPAWPSLDSIMADQAIYREYPQISPPLRKTLRTCSPEKAASFYASLVRGEAETMHVYLPRGEDAPPKALPWELPASLAGDWSHEIYSSAEAAARDAGWHILEASLSGRRQQATELSRQRRRLTRSLERLEADADRLRRMAGLRLEAELLQGQLYRFDVHSKRNSLQVVDESGETRRLELDPQLTVLQNMQQWFERARKGERGLEIVSRRREALQQELQRLELRGRADSSQAEPDQAAAWPRSEGKAKPAGKKKGLSVHEFQSSDGYTILRGKNSRANHHLLSQAAKPFDYWFHAEDGPGAHVILRRDHEGQAVPRRSLLEAAMLAGLASHQAGEAKARVLCALVKDVRKLKGAPHGQVRVEALQESILVELDGGLEQALKRS